MPSPTKQKTIDFTFTSTQHEQAKLSDFQGKKIVLYFYPKDSTPGCTIESKDFTKLHKKFEKANAVVFGVSKDSLKSHHKFAEKHNMPFALIEDESKAICEQFNVLKEKSMFGRKYMGIERSTFLIDEQGHLIREWRKVKITGHAQEVLDLIAST